MKSLGPSRYALAMGAAAALLGGCGGSQPPIAAPGAMPQSRAMITHGGRNKSWMLPEAKHDDLLYVAYQQSGDIQVFTYPRGRLVGTLAGVHSPNFLCSDKAGNVWIPVADEVVEYAHGGTKPIATLHVPKVPPHDCAVDPVTGDLAVAGAFDGGSYLSAFVIYKHAQGSPRIRDVNFLADSLSYDGNGNLFVDGRGLSSSGFVLGELPAGKSKFRRLSVNADYDYFGAVRWDGKYVDVSLYEFIYRFTIMGNSAVKVDSIFLGGVKYIGSYWVQGSKVVATDWFGDGSYPAAEIYKYPAGGQPIRSIPGTQGWGVTVSVAPR